jgi:hypothetical protein
MQAASRLIRGGARIELAINFPKFVYALACAFFCGTLPWDVEK